MLIGIRMDFIGAKDDRGGGDKLSCELCKASVRSSNQHQVFYRPDAPLLTHPTVSVH